MTESIIVRRHGGRWAIQEGGEQTPVAEYETRELAEAAARSRAGGREVVVDDRADDEQLGTGGTGESAGVPGADAGIDQRTGGGGSGTETPREPQSGL